MASPALSARLRYLNDSAHLLARSAPATSKHLMSRCNALMFEGNLEQSDSHKRKVCGACGTIMVLGWGSTLKLESQKPSRRRGSRNGRSQNEAGAKAIVYTCGSCGRNTRHNIALPPATKRSLGLSSSVSLPTENMNQSSTQAKLALNPGISANASSKKRAKTRKRGALQAIIEKHKASAGRESGSFGLDLMDLMKKS